jgi:hypothetical protein
MVLTLTTSNVCATPSIRSHRPAERKDSEDPSFVDVQVSGSRGVVRDLTIRLWVMTIPS